jgi:hypothetical protein
LLSPRPRLLNEVRVPSREIRREKEGKSVICSLPAPRPRLLNEVRMQSREIRREKEKNLRFGSLCFSKKKSVL